jgi:putative nucleotidyltransferase with HDIG domain
MVLNSKEFVPIPINEFVKGVMIPVDLYVRLSEQKFVLVGKAGSHSNVDQFQNYQNKEVKYLWVQRKEYYKLAHQSVTLAGIALSKADLNDTQKTSIVTHAARTTFRQLDHLGLDIESYNNAKQIATAVIGLVENHKVFTDLFLSLANVSDQLLAHSVAVSSLSVVLGGALGFEKQATLEKLGMGGLLHDIGLKALPKELVAKPLSAMTSDEIQIYETHPYKGAQMLMSLGIVPDDVVSIVYEHQENAIGQGYPQRLRDVKMHPLAKVVSLADAYAELILPNINCPVPKNPREALMYIEHTLGIPFNKEAFRALKKIIEGPAKAKGA